MSREALKMALEALENGKRVRAFEGGTKFQEPLEDAAITAIKAALVTKDVSLPEQEPVGWQWLDTANFRKKIPPTGESECWNPVYTSPPQRQPLTLDCYDAGLLSDFGGGNVDWWQDYIRAELDRAHDFYQSQAAHGIGDKT